MCVCMCACACTVHTKGEDNITPFFANAAEISTQRLCRPQWRPHQAATGASTNCPLDVQWPRLFSKWAHHLHTMGIQ